MILLSLRHFVDSDAVALFRWWNDRESRRFSGDGAPVAWDAHLAWVAANIANPHWYVGDIGAEYVYDRDLKLSQRISVGASRVEVGDDTLAWISAVIDPRWRGLGFGKELIRLVTDEFHFGSAQPIFARIHQLNIVSQRAFIACGYEEYKRVGVWAYYRKNHP